MKILLIGASGCFGTEFKKACKNSKIRISFFPSKKLNITDYSNLKKKISLIRPKIIINSSALVGINQCEAKYEKAFSINSVGSLYLSKLCNEMNIILVQTSTHAVFDGKKLNSYTENDIPMPNNIYSGTKYLAEKFVSSICTKYYIIRFPTLFGERNNGLYGFVDKVILALKENKTLKIAKDKMDSPTYAKDAAYKLLEIISQKKPYGTYHLANQGRISYFEFVRYMKKILRSKSKIIPVKDSYFTSNELKPLRTSIRSNKLSKMRGWRDSIREYLDYYQYEQNI